MQGSARKGGRILYRCEYGSSRSLSSECSHPPTVYVREEAITPQLDEWLASLATPEVLAASAPPESELEALQQRLGESTTKLARLVSAIEAGGDMSVLNPRIATLSDERRDLERQLDQRRRARPLTSTEIAELVAQVHGIIRLLETATPAERAKVYSDLGVSLTYDPREQMVHAAADLGRVVNVRVGGGA